MPRHASCLPGWQHPANAGAVSTGRTRAGAKATSTTADLGEEEEEKKELQIPSAWFPAKHEHSSRLSPAASSRENAPAGSFYAIDALGHTTKGCHPSGASAGATTSHTSPASKTWTAHYGHGGSRIYLAAVTSLNEVRPHTQKTHQVPRLRFGHLI
jgi:hypothetical protein